VLTGPFIEREMRTAWRRQNPVNVRFWLAVGGFAVSLFFMFFNPGQLGTIGSEMHQLLFWAGIILIFQVPRTTAGMFAEDRRNGTLGLLFLCGIRPAELFTGKLLGAVLIAYTHLLGLFPFLAIAFLVGGVSIKLFVATLACLPALLFFAFAVCTLASVLTEDESAAQFMAYVLSAVICLATPAVFWVNGIFSDTQTMSRDWLALSPAFPAFVVGSGLGGGTSEQFWAGCAMTLIWSLLCLGIAGAVVVRVWRDRPKDAGYISWWAQAQSWWRGDQAWRRRLARRWLDSHPFTWIATRDRRQVNLAWLVIGTLLVLWAVACWCWPQRWPGPANFFLTCTALNLALHWLALFAAAKTIGTQRADGSLELLLSTPLKEADIVTDQLLALRNQFRPVAGAVIGVELLMMIAGWLMRDWSVLAAIIYFSLWAVIIRWTAVYAGTYRFTLTCFWDSLVSGRPAYVAGRSLWEPFALGWWLWFIAMLTRNFKPGSRINPLAFPEGNYIELLLLVVGILCLFIYFKRQGESQRDREQLLNTMLRRVAEEPPPEPSDPRFKDWNSGEPFPEAPPARGTGRNEAPAK